MDGQIPSTLTVSTNACNIPGGVSTSFNAPAPWDGQCDSTTQSPSGMAYSLTIDALTMKQDGCAVGLPAPAKVLSPYWKTYARACAGRWGSGPTSQSICIPKDHQILTAFRLCVIQKGDNDCAEVTGNKFTERHVFYVNFEDNRQCSACTCGPPTGSLCTAPLSIYKGANLTCSAPALEQYSVSSASPKCIDIQPPGQSVGSKSAGPTTYLPGTCQPMGGHASGAAVKSRPATLCCRP